MNVLGQLIELDTDRSVFVGKGEDEDIYIRFVNAEHQLSWLRLSPEAVHALSNLLVAHSTSTELTSCLRADFNTLLVDPLVYKDLGTDSYSGMGET